MLSLLILSLSISADPSELTTAREKYEANLKIVQQEYVNSLQKLIKKFGADGNIEAAIAVKKEIDLFNLEPISIIGVWRSGGNNREYLKNGFWCDKDGTIRGKWKVVDVKKHIYQSLWINKGKIDYIDTLQLSNDGQSFKAKNQKGDTFEGQRVPK